MASSSIDPPTWNWPGDLPGAWVNTDETKPQEPRQRQPYQSDSASPPRQESSSSTQSTDQGRGERHYRPRTCRICLETVLPTYNPPSESLPSFMRSSPSVTYESEDGGRLLRPCLCKGSQKYVHEQCLQAWRLQDPLANRNYWQCPTCRYKYRLERMTWGRWISSTGKPVHLILSYSNLLTTRSFSDHAYSSHLSFCFVRSRLCCRPYHQSLS